MNKACYYLFGLKLPLYLNFALPALIFYNPLAKLLKNKYFRIVLILLIPALIIIRLLRNDPFFLSDDFAHLNLSWGSSYLDIARQALGPGGIWVNHKIIIAFWLFKAIFDIFGTNPVPYLVAMFLIQSANSLLFYLLLTKMKQNNLIALLTTIIFSTFYLTWISNIHEVLAGTFVLLTLLFWIEYLQKRKKKYYWGTLVFYILGLFTKEITFLVGPSLILFTIFYHNYLRKLKFRNLLKAFTPILIVFLLYSVFFASSFLGYANIAGDVGYKMRFSFEVLLGNLTYYTNMLLPIIEDSWIRFGLVLLVAVALDLKKKRLIATPLLVSYLLLVAPPSFFSARSSNYYVYIPAIFFFAFLFLILQELSLVLKKYLQGKGIGQRLLIIYSLLGLLVGIYGIDKIFLDNCFLIQFPWARQQKTAFLSLIGKIDEKLEKGELKEGSIIALGEEEYDLDFGGINPFLKSTISREFNFKYLPEKKVLLVEKR